MNRHDDEWDEDGIEDEEAIALRAVEAWLDVEGDDELAQASREALAAIAQEALAKNDRREAREAAARRRRLAQDRAEADERFARREAERLAQQAHHRAVEEAHARVASVDVLQPRRAPSTPPARRMAGRLVGAGAVAPRDVRPVIPVRVERLPVPMGVLDENDVCAFEDDDLDDVADDFREAATEAIRAVLDDVMPSARPSGSSPGEEPIRFRLGHESTPLTGSAGCSGARGCPDRVGPCIVAVRGRQSVVLVGPARAADPLDPRRRPSQCGPRRRRGDRPTTLA